MNLSIVVTALISLLLSCGSRGPQSTSAAGGTTSTGGDKDAPAPALSPEQMSGPFRFAWPVPCHVTILADTHKKGKQMKARYEVTLSESPGSEDLLLEHRGFKILEYEGRKVTGGLTNQVAPLEALSAFIPPVRISREGRYLGLPEGFTMVQLFDQMRKEIMKDVSEEIWLDLREMMAAPGMEEALSSKAGDFWRTWVESWVALTLRPGESHKEEWQVPLGDGTTSTAAVTLWNDGEAKSPPGAIRLRLTSVQHGQALRDYIVSLTLAATGLNTVAGSAIKSYVDSIADVRTTTTISAVIDPGNLRPAAVETEKVIIIVATDGTETPRVEKSLYTFTWD